jgi:hypothetical protein
LAYAQKLETMTTLDPETRQAAALSARKLAFSALQRGNRLEAMQLLLRRLETNAA